jgi:hypothetical protein
MREGEGVLLQIQRMGMGLVQEPWIRKQMKITEDGRSSALENSCAPWPIAAPKVYLLYATQKRDIPGGSFHSALLGLDNRQKRKQSKDLISSMQETARTVNPSPEAAIRLLCNLPRVPTLQEKPKKG